VRELGFVGAMINGFSQVGAEDTAVYLDDARYRAFWAAVQELDVPIYLHPRDSLPSRSQIYEGHPWLLGSAWAFSVETGTHALRLMGSGLFDVFPRLQVILGHFGELLPFNIWRTDHRIEVARNDAVEVAARDLLLVHLCHRLRRALQSFGSVEPAAPV